jgi:lysophospholipase L1-like esterase
MRAGLLLLVAVVLAAGEPLHLVAIGDSLTAGGHLPRAVAAGLRESGRWDPVLLTVLAQGGATPTQMLDRIRSATWALPAPATGARLAIILAGTNAYDEAAVLALARTVAGAGWPVAVLATPPRRHPRGATAAGYGPPQANRDFNRRLAALVVPPLRWIDARDALREPGRDPAQGDWLDPALAADHTHLTAEGSRRFGAAVAAAVRPTP